MLFNDQLAAFVEDRLKVKTGPAWSGKLGDDAVGPAVGVWVRQWGTGREFGFAGDTVFHPASTIKVGLLAGLYHLADKGKFNLDDKVEIANSSPSSIDGSRFELSAEDDEEKTLYARVGEHETLREIGRLMIVRSSNLGTNLLMDHVSPADVTALMTSLGGGAEALLLRNRMMDIKAFDAGKTNRGTARGLCRLMDAIGKGELPGSPEMIKVLLQQELNDGLPVGLGKHVKVAHKTGGITAHYHDIGIVRPGEKNAYAIAVLTRGFTVESEATCLVADLAARIDGQLR